MTEEKLNEDIEKEKIEEDFHIDINNDDEKQHIKEINVILNTTNTASVEYLTELVQGELLGVIIDSEKQTNIMISLDGYNDIILFEKVGFLGQKYLSLVNDGTYPDGEVIQDSSQRWVLNDRIRIRVDGNLNTQVKFVFRYR